MPRVSVYFATNRAPMGAPDDPASYATTGMVGPNRPQDMTYGLALLRDVGVAGVSYPEGTYSRDGYGTIEQLEDVQTGSFSASIQGDLSDPGKNILVFLHGFDNNFSDALTRAAFNGAWLAASGLAGTDVKVVTWSWPSRGGPVLGGLFDLERPYRDDQAAAKASGPHARAFLANLVPLLSAARARGNRTVLLAHSMGNWALQWAMEKWAETGEGNAILFDAAILAAADCGADAFSVPPLSCMTMLTQLSKRVVVAFNGSDQVLGISQLVNGGHRLGRNGPPNRDDPAAFPPSTYTMWDCTGVHDYFYENVLDSHQYYRLSPTVRGWIATLFATAAAP